MRTATRIEDPAQLALCHASAALDAAELSGRPFEMSQALASVARSYRGLNALPRAEAALAGALRWARLGGSADAVVELLCDLSETAAALAETLDACRAGSGHTARERARDHAFEATTLAGRVADPAWEIKVLLRVSALLARCGDSDDAMRLQTRALRLQSGRASSATDPRLLPSLGRLADR